MSYMYGFRRVPFLFSKNRLSKILFQILSQKDAQIVNLQNPDLDLIRRIRPESGFNGFMSRFWIFPKKTQNPFLDSEIRIWIFPTKTQPPPPPAPPRLEDKKNHKWTWQASSRYNNFCHCMSLCELFIFTQIVYVSSSRFIVYRRSDAEQIYQTSIKHYTYKRRNTRVKNLQTYFVPDCSWCRWEIKLRIHK